MWLASSPIGITTLDLIEKNIYIYITYITCKLGVLPTSELEFCLMTLCTCTDTVVRGFASQSP